MNGKREFGDYQTPSVFAERICDLLRNERGVHPSAILEPTCGIGSFLRAALRFDASELYGIERNPDYCSVCRSTIKDERVTIINGDFFHFPTKSLFKNKTHLLILGNPPWANNSTLSALNSNNVPEKSNFKRLRGMDAITGASNFDICESIILQLIQEYSRTNTTIAMLCKTTVARNVFMEMRRTGVCFSSCELFTFDAVQVFGIHANACLLLVQLTERDISVQNCDVYGLDDPKTKQYSFGEKNGRLFSKTDSPFQTLDGVSCFEWRQGVKHDCSKVMELSVCDGRLQNGNGTTVSIEDRFLYPLVKSSMIKTPIIHQFSKQVIVTQRKARDDTDWIQTAAPLTWEYLTQYTEAFLNRKSAIYNGAPRFSMFGVGDYSYARYKVGVSGFYKKPLFSVLYSDNGKPVMMDDTSYFICLPTFSSAYVAMLLLNSEPVQTFLLGIAFTDAKRPFTKKVLERIDFQQAVRTVRYHDLLLTERNLGLRAYLTEKAFIDFLSLPELAQQSYAI